MDKKQMTIVFVLLGVVIVGYFVYPTIFNGLLVMRSFLGEDIGKTMDGKFKDKSTDYLIQLTKSRIMDYSGTAFEILEKRKDEKIFQYFLKLLRSKNKEMKSAAIGSLGAIGDARAIPYLIDIVNRGKTDTDYWNALNALANIHYEPIYPEIVRYSEEQLSRDGGDIGLAIGLLKKYPGQEKSMELLNKVLSRDSKERYSFKGEAEDAIKEIKEWKKKQK